MVDFSIAFADNLFAVTSTGRASVREYEDLLATLTIHEKWQPGSLVLSDERTLETSHLSTREITRVANICAAHSGAMGEAKIAILASEDLVFGLNRMWQVFVEDRWEATVQVFRSRAEAIEWLYAAATRET